MTNRDNSFPPRLGTDSYKWAKYRPEIIPLWVADMDFAAIPEVTTALIERSKHNLYGYGQESETLRNLIRERLLSLYQWQIKNEDIVFLPGLVPGLNTAVHALCQTDDEILVMPPIYRQFLTLAENQKCKALYVPLKEVRDNNYLKYEVDFSGIKKSITNKTKLLMLSHPHNPIGKIFSISELQNFATLALGHDLIICSDEIFSDLILSGEHKPLAACCPEIRDRIITLMSPSKTFNLSGLGLGYAIITNQKLRVQFQQAMAGLVAQPNIMAFAAAIAAYQHGNTWLSNVNNYLLANLKIITDFFSNNLPEVSFTMSEASYLIWLDFSKTKANNNAANYLLEKAKVALSSGLEFGPDYQAYARLNFACKSELLKEALDRIYKSLK